MNARIFIAVAALLSPWFANAQDVQWACEVVSCSEKYSGGEDDYKPQQALGEPDAWQTRPRATSKCFLFGWDEKPDDEVSTEASVTVKFCNPQKVNQIAIVENCNPGSITGVFLYDNAGNKQQVYTGEAKAIDVPKRILQITIPYTTYEVASLKIVGQPSDVKGWNGIDGIGIADSPNPIDIPIKVENLGPRINTEYDDLSPRIAPDGRTLWFVREGHPDNVGMWRLDDDQDIWTSTQDANGVWQEAKNVGKPINNGTYNWLISISPDGNTAVFASRYNTDGTHAGPGLSVGTKVRGQWQVPKNIEVENFYNKNDYADYFLSNDKRILILSIQQNDSRGDLDLYVSFKTGTNEFSAPKNLGKVINSRKTDAAPFLASDGETLYFSSNGHGGYGDNDIFMCKRLDDTWTNWSEPKNLGSEINSDDYESDFSISAQGDYAYLVRYVDNYGGGDIFRVALDKEVQPNPVVLVQGKVLNAKTKEPIGADILYELLLDGTPVGTASSDGNTGEYKIILPYGKAYGFLAQASGYYPINENVDLSNLKEFQIIERDLLLAPVEVGQTIRLNNIFFDSGESILLPESYPELNRVTELLESNKSLKIELSGHTDNVGSDSANQTLSQDRAQACVNYLTGKGVSADRIVVKGYGESAPVATNDTDEGRALNRRVEFKVLELK